MVDGVVVGPVAGHLVKTLLVEFFSVFDCFVETAQEAPVEANAVEFVFVGLALWQIRGDAGRAQLLSGALI